MSHQYAVICEAVEGRYDSAEHVAFSPACRGEVAPPYPDFDPLGYWKLPDSQRHLSYPEALVRFVNNAADGFPVKAVWVIDPEGGRAADVSKIYFDEVAAQEEEACNA